MSRSEPADPFHHLFGKDRRQTSERYYFDIDDGDAFHSDETGIDLADADHIASEAYNALKQIVYDKWPEGQRTMTVRVRDRSGKVVYEGAMTIDGRRFPP